MSSDQFAIRARDISKHYVMFARPEDRLKQMIVPRLQRAMGRTLSRYYRDFAALNNVSFDIHRGETIGILGRNGSGKSTLLQIVCGTLQPTSGNIEVNGRIAALLELGAGFNPEFTGRENVYLNAAILGLSRAEIDIRFDSIARFADIGDFIEQPVKTYSSGMYVRLAFATAINVDPDILVVDEALSVGDEAFQRKCFARIEEIKERGGTILFVSHSAQAIVQLCDRAILIDAGEKILEGAPKAVVGQYQRLVNLSGSEAQIARKAIKAIGRDGTDVPAQTENHSSTAILSSPFASEQQPEDRTANNDTSWLDPALISHSRIEYESQGARIRDVRVATLDGRQVNVLEGGKRYLYQYTVDFDLDVRNVGFGMLIKTVSGLELGGGATDFTSSLILPIAKAGTSYEISFDVMWSLNPGIYFLNAGVSGTTEKGAGYSHRLLDAMAIRVQPKNEKQTTGYVDFNPMPKITLVSTGK